MGILAYKTKMAQFKAIETASKSGDKSTAEILSSEVALEGVGDVVSAFEQ